jgi:type IV pilus assembly protein PilW
MKKGSRGLGLVELMVALSLGLIIVLGITRIFLSAKNTYLSQSASAGLQEDARFALSKLVQEIRAVAMFGCLATVDDKSAAGDFQAAFKMPISHVSDVAGSVLSLVTADADAATGSATWNLLSDCVSGATAYSQGNTPALTEGQISFPIRQVMYTYRNNQLLVGPAGNQAVLLNNVSRFDVTFGVAQALGDAVASGYSAAPANPGLIRSVRLTMTLSDPSARVADQTFNVVASLRNRML